MKILLFGATGSAGGSAWRVCLADAGVQEVRKGVRNRIVENADMRRLAKMI